MPRPPHVPSGKWGTQIVFWSPITKTEIDPTPARRKKIRFSVLRSYTVFCVDQVEGDHLDHLRAGHGETDTDGATHRLRARRGGHRGDRGDIRHGGGQAFYRRPVEGGDGDYHPGAAQAPFAAGRSTTRRSSTNSSTATEHPARLDWCRKTAYLCRWGTAWPRSARATSLAELGVPAERDLTNHIAYLANWLQAMQDDPRFIFTACHGGQQSRRLPPRLQPTPGRRGGRARSGPGRVTDP